MKEETLKVSNKDIADYLGIKVEDIPEEYNDYVGTYVIKEWTFGERERIIGESSEQTIDSDGRTRTRLISSVFRLAVMQNCIKLTPLKAPPTSRYLQEMPTWLGEALWEKVNSLNETMGRDEAKKFKFS